MNTNSFSVFRRAKKTSEVDDWANKEALMRRTDSILAAEKARTDAVLERLGLRKPKTRGWRISPVSVDPPANAAALKENTQRSPETLSEVFEDPFLQEKQHVSTSLSVCSTESFSSVDTQTPWELRDIPLIRTPEVFIPSPPPPHAAPQPRRRRSLIPVMIRRILKRPEKAAVNRQRAELQGEPLKKGPKRFRRNSVAPLPRPATAPKKTRPVPAPKPDPPKNKRPSQRGAVGFAKTTNMKKPALQAVKPRPKEELKPLPNPVQSLSLAFQHLSLGDWEKKMEGLKVVRALAQHHPDTLMGKLHEVCVAITDEIKNLRSCVACAAIDTLGSLYTHLQKDTDVEVERSGRALLLRVAQASANVFVQQQINLALGAMVKNCSPGRVLTALLNTGLSHLSVAVRASAAQQLHLLADEMGATAVLTAGPSFTPSFLRALSKMCLDAAAEVRGHGHAVLQELCLHKDFMKLWQKAVGERERLSLKKVLQKARKM